MNPIDTQFDPYPLRIETLPAKGRYFVATDDVKNGQVVLKVLPYATAIFDNFKKRVCGYCLYYHARGSLSLHCTGCDQVYFCSRPCMRAYLEGNSANAATHRECVCIPFRRLATLRADRHLKSVAKLLVHVLWERKRERMGLEWRREEGWWRAYADDADGDMFRDNADRPVLDEDTKEPSTVVDTLSFSLLNTLRFSEHLPSPHVLKSNYNLTHALQSHYTSWPTDDVKDWRKQHSFLLSILNDAKLLDEDEGIDEVMHLASKIESNGFGLYAGKIKAKRCSNKAVVVEKEKDKESEMVCFGRGLYPYASFFNHNCDYNCDCEQEEIDSHTLIDNEVDLPSSLTNETVISSANAKKEEEEEEIQESSPQNLQQPSTKAPANQPVVLPTPRGAHRVMTVTATRDIPAGTDLTITYIDADQPLSVRRSRLQEDYYFTCLCEKCVAEDAAGVVGREKGKGKGKKEKEGRKVKVGRS